jgi:hypothetical protein
MTTMYGLEQIGAEINAAHIERLRSAAARRVSPSPCSACAIFAGGQMADFYLHEIRFRA